MMQNKIYFYKPDLELDSDLDASSGLASKSFNWRFADFAENVEIGLWALDPDEFCFFFEWLPRNFY